MCLSLDLLPAPQASSQAKYKLVFKANLPQLADADSEFLYLGFILVEWSQEKTQNMII